MTRQTHRTERGGRIDRDTPLVFTFDGKRYTGYRGDTLASALLANGVRLVGRSFKYHRRRGIFGAGAEEPNALVRVGTGSRAEPNLKATRVALHDGLQAQSQNRWPSLGLDAGALINAASKLFPAGFYYKTFMWPGSWWMLYERFIRRAAGLGRAPLDPDPDHYDRRYAFCDVLVVGAGPAGLMAALTAARSGARVMLVDDALAPGGSLAASTATIEDADPIAFATRVREELASNAKVRVLDRTTAFGYYDDNMVVAVERRADGAPAPHCARQRVWWIRAGEVVIATGAIERPLPFENNDLPGVMLASAARTYAFQHGVRLGERAVLFTNNDSAYEALEPMLDAGTNVVAVVDARDGGPGDDALAVVRRLGLELVSGSVVMRAIGRTGVGGVEVRSLSADGEAVGDDSRRIPCDLVCVSGGWSPTVHLFSQSQGRLRFDAARAAFVPGESAQRERSAGAARGLLGLSECLADGAAAGADAARAAGFDAGSEPVCPEVREWAEGVPVRPLWAVPLPSWRHGKRFVDFQNDVTVADIELAAREGYRSVEHLKRYTTLGMGTDQGRTSNVNGLAVLAATLGTEIPAVGTTTFRPPYSPVALGAIAGREVGIHQAPVRRTPMHDWHVEHGATFVTVGPWLRAQYYLRPGESMMDAINREARHVRRAVGMVDVSTLGKIEIRGRDAGEFLHRVYINRIRNLRVGRCRYAFMLREDGFVLDDGTCSRIRDDMYYLTTGTGHAATVMAHLERYAQTVWPDLDVHLTSVTDQWAGAAVAGPRSRDLLAAACDGAGVSDEALPFMGCIEATVAGAPVRIIRMTFSGERAYEVHCPADYGIHVWEALLAAGESFEVMPYGTEALGVLRIEKGHVVPNELDGRTIPADFGFDRMEKDEDFIGRRSLERFREGGRRRKTFVGLISENGKGIPRGGHLVWNPTAPRPVTMLGHVTSGCYSPTLERHIALALMDDGEDWKGRTLYAASPLTADFAPVRITDHVFIDPENRRPKG
ncbi:MAG: sarcosine oxidase subunit alpha family protein [Thiotrichales bacterium]|nr:sarcosine oxidase subunit alpha family protein [Thiotrichales bacterium]